jgi:hypothetical protein
MAGAKKTSKVLKSQSADTATKGRVADFGFVGISPQPYQLLTKSFKGRFPAAGGAVSGGEEDGFDYLYNADGGFVGCVGPAASHPWSAR